MRLLLRLLVALTDRTLADAIAGDLQEERRRRSGPMSAVWFWRAAAGIVLFMLVRGGKGIVLRMMSSGFGLGDFRGEQRQAIRALRRSPWYAVTVIGVIALSIAMAATVFAIVDGVLFKPLPYRNASELHAISGPFSAVKSMQEVHGPLALPSP